jgi:outer membrane protein OmpA-like peptidoglycan-associated protein
MPKNRGSVFIGKDDEANNELAMTVNTLHNKHNVQVNDYITSKKDDEADNELFGAAAAPRRSQNQPVAQPVYLIVQQAPPQPKPEPEQRMWYSLSRSLDDEADNELFGVAAAPRRSENQPIAQPVYLIVQQAPPQPKPEPQQRMWYSLHRSLDDEADNELARVVNIPHNKGNFAVNDFSTHDDEFAVSSSTSKKLNQDEIDVLASLLKHAPQNKEGKVTVDGIKIGGIPKQGTKKAEGPKVKNFLGL